MPYHALSHIFFVDDLLLFGETSFSQARIIEFLLADFCGFQGNVLAGVSPGLGSLLTLRCIYGTQFVLNSKFWGKFCCPFKFGGLGVPNLQEMNLALLSKLLW